MGEIGFDMAPDPGQIFEITRFVITLGETRKNACNPEIAMRADNGIGGVKCFGFEGGKSVSKASNHVSFQTFWKVTPHILEERYEIVRKWRDNSILKIEQAYLRNTVTFRQPHQIGGMKIAQSEA